MRNEGAKTEAQERSHIYINSNVDTISGVYGKSRPAQLREESKLSPLEKQRE